LQRKVAIAEGMDDLHDYFSRRGFTVVGPEQANQSVALVVSGSTDNFMGMHDRSVDVPVINAEGKTPDEILQQVEKASKAKS